MSEPDKELDDLAYEVIGACLEMHRTIGPGHLESHYGEAVAVEFTLHHIPFGRQVKVTLPYKGQIVGEGRLDFLIARRLILEIKAVETLLPVHTAQVISYLRITGHRLALLINFNVPVLKDGIKRIVLS
ncbi:GxxExxY protein [Candidatus Sumerlaeota bacterium]|nr:GxxExxY protein [Candidatus Sumerlaeota bacterium]MBI3736555.1 GxxExxY protein [Candidatus Sumerlaeota bacterium]